MTMQDLLLDAVEQRVLRQLDVQFAMMIAADQPAVMLAAALLSKDAGEGHVCLPLSRLVVDEKMPPVLQSCFALLGERVDWQKILRESSAVGPGDNQAPLILTGERLYLNRLWRNELTVARFFSETNAPLPCDEAQLRQTLDRLFDSGEDTDWQKVAAAVALTRRPGNGENNDRRKAAGSPDTAFRRAAMPYSSGGAHREGCGASDRITGRRDATAAAHSGAACAFPG